jgi:hypothetical protein
MRVEIRGAGVALALLAVAADGAIAQVSPGKLSRAHAAYEGPLACTTCHAGKDEGMDANCLSCHGEIAALEKAGRGLHAAVQAQRCAACHPEHAGRDFELIMWEEKVAEKFDHRRAGWPLEGKHAAAACRACHRPERRDPALAKLIQRKDPARSWVGLSTACATCHRDPHQGTLGAACASCHDANVWKPAARFEHARAAFALTGKHAGVACVRCHPPAGKPTAGQASAPLRLKPIPHAECSACHRDPHEGKLGTACSGCHVTEDFRKIETASFRHDLTRFPLRGRHAAVACASCHDPKQAWGKTPPFARCDGCHRDAHAGTATLAGKAADCAACHAVSGWTPATYGVKEHAGARYALEGKHREVACRSCHTRPTGAEGAVLGSAGVQLRPRFSACRDCHPDAHAGQLAARPGAEDCAPCHTVFGFKPSLFGPVQHAALRLPLEGKHAAAACRACHGPDRKGLPGMPGKSVLGDAGVWLALGATTCEACHADPHHGKWREPSTGCRSCHDTASFHRSAVDVARHEAFGFKLEGAHRAVPCVGCHPELKHPPATSTLVAAAAGLPDLPFGQKRSACADCHPNPHGDQFAAKPNACERCHGPDAFRPATEFDHDRDATFALKGGHEKVPCARCHPTRTVSGQPQVLYRPLDGRCRTCHGGTS